MPLLDDGRIKAQILSSMSGIRRFTFTTIFSTYSLIRSRRYVKKTLEHERGTTVPSQKFCYIRSSLILLHWLDLQETQFKKHLELLASNS